MDDELKQLLKEDIDLTKKGQEVMTKILRYQKWALIWGIIKWTIIIGSTLGALYYLQPMLDGALNYYQTILETVSSTSVNTLP
jgi:hypothetical protein